MKLFKKMQNAIEKLNAALTRTAGGRMASDERAEAYIGEAVKILIAVVIGALLLTLAYALMKDTVFPAVAQKVTEMFSYSA